MSVTKKKHHDYWFTWRHDLRCENYWFFLERHVQLRGIKRERVFFNRNLLVSLLSGRSWAVIKSQNPRHQSTLIIITSSINLREKIEQSSTCARREKHNCCENLSHHKFLLSTLTLIWLSDLAHFFLSKWLLYSLNIHNLGTHLAHTQMEQIWPNRTSTHCFTTISTYQPNELPSIYFKFFLLKMTSETQKFKFDKFLHSALSPTQKSPKDPKSILILTMKLLHTYFWKMLPVGALIWLALIWLNWAQITQPTSSTQKVIVL